MHIYSIPTHSLQPTSETDDNIQYAKVCVQLLSRPLPNNALLPASAEPFFLRTFDRAIKAPDVATLKPVYYMLNGACSGLLGLLAPHVREEFDQELCRILSSSSAGQNSMLLVWCIGIVVLSEQPRNVKDADKHFAAETPPKLCNTSERQWKTAPGQKLFASTKGLEKTINLITLSVIWASKGDVGVPDDEAVEGIRIANRVLNLVSPDTCRGWLRSSPLAKSALQKLPTKILRNGIDEAVQLEVRLHVRTYPCATYQYRSSLENNANQWSDYGFLC